MVGLVPTGRGVLGSGPSSKPRQQNLSEKAALLEQVTKVVVWCRGPPPTQPISQRTACGKRCRADRWGTRSDPLQQFGKLAQNRQLGHSISAQSCPLQRRIRSCPDCQGSKPIFAWRTGGDSGRFVHPLVASRGFASASARRKAQSKIQRPRVDCLGHHDGLSARTLLVCGPLVAVSASKASCNSKAGGRPGSCRDLAVRTRNAKSGPSRSIGTAARPFSPPRLAEQRSHWAPNRMHRTATAPSSTNSCGKTCLTNLG